VAKYGFDGRYEIGPQVASSAVRNALLGYSGYCHDHCDGLITDKSERENLAFAHNKHTGTEIYKQKRGIDALTARAESRLWPQERPHSGAAELPASDRLPRPVAGGSSRALPKACTARPQGGRRGFRGGQGLGSVRAGGAWTDCGLHKIHSDSMIPRHGDSVEPRGAGYTLAPSSPLI
jgi:hypothetical protein